MKHRGGRSAAARTLVSTITIGSILGGLTFTGQTAFAEPGKGVTAQPAATPVPHPVGPAVIPEHIQMGPDPGCLSCHGGIEDAMINMPPSVSCVFCHGGDPDATSIGLAHVQPTLPVINDMTVAPLDYDLPYQRFVNPSNLRVADQTCGQCHSWFVELVLKSMMATAAGHYAGGLYQNGVVDTKTPIYGTFAISDDDGVVPTGQGAVPSLLDLITYDPAGDPTDPATHFAAVPAQACARCHLWSSGKGYRGAVDKDGTYRADGCAACHMLYANDGRSLSADASIDHVEQGHPMHHIITREIPTEQCVHCHHRGARIGLSFTGRAQMPPRLPSGPGVAGTSDVQFNNNYHYTDAETNPQDIHGELGLNCVDCHTIQGVMGDGNIWGHMDQATKVECQTCHGALDAPGTLIDNDGYHLRNVTDDGKSIVLTSKVDGTDHDVHQVVDIVDPASELFNARAACAMDGNHLKANGGLECYACHAYWTPNCFGCHFERDERFMGTNLVTRQQEIGRVRTNNKIFESLKHFFMGPNRSGKIAPYIVSCDPTADVTAPDGSKILDMVMPSTVNDLSGLGRNPVYAHSMRGKDEVRTCAECHRSPAALGLGSGNYALARNYALTAAHDGVQVFDRRTDPVDPSFVDTLPAGRPLAVASWADPMEGTVDYLYVASGLDGLFVFDLCNGLSTTPLNVLPGINAVDVSRNGAALYVVVEGVGVQIYDDDPSKLQLLSTIPIPGAQRAVPWGIHLFVAAGDAGFVVVNVADPGAPQIVGGLDDIRAEDIRLYAHFQKSRHYTARAYIADRGYGVHIVDLLPDFDFPVLVGGIPLDGARGLDTYTRYLPADGAVPSREHDYLYVVAGAAGLHVYDITDPDQVVAVSSLPDLGGNAMHVDVVSAMAPPGTDDYAFVANRELGLQLIDVTDPLDPTLVTAKSSLGAMRVFVEVQAMDRFIDEQGNLLKENSHPGVGQFTRNDIVRILSAPIAADCLLANDFDGDGDVDSIDALHFTACLQGPGSIAPSACAPADVDQDGDVDLTDFSAMQLLFGS